MPAVSGTGAPISDSHGYPRTYNRYSSGPIDEMARYDMIVGWKWFDIAGLRARNPNGIFLLNPAMTTSLGYDAIHVTAPGPAAAWPGRTDDQPGGVNLGSMRAVDPNWDLLHNADGSYATPAGYSWIKGWNLADPTGKGTPELVAKLFAYAAKQNGLYAAGWDGVESDNWIFGSIGAGWFYGPNLDTNRDGTVDDYTALRRNWSNGLTLVGNRLRSYLPGKIVGGNGAWYRPEDYTGSDPEGWLKSSNYTMVEHMEKFSYSTPDSFLALTRRWLDYSDPLGQPRYMAVIQNALDANGNMLPNSSNPNDPAIMLGASAMRSMRWGLTLSLMTDVYYAIHLASNHDTRWWYDEYDGGEGVRRRGYLGQPLSAPVKLADGLYRRDFQSGIALNNSSAASQTVQLGGAFTKLRGTQNPTLNDGSSVTSVTIPAHDGIILLRTAGVLPKNTALPALSGTAADGRVLTSSTGTWSGTAPITYTFRWRRCDAAGTNCADIAGATGNDYTLTSADVGSKVYTLVAATNAAGSASARTYLSATVALR